MADKPKNPAPPEFEMPNFKPDNTKDFSKTWKPTFVDNAAKPAVKSAAKPVVKPEAKQPATGWYGEDYRKIIGKPNLSEEWKVPDPMQGDNRPKKPKD